MERWRIRADDLSHPASLALVERHLRGMLAASPPESVRAIGVAALRAPGVSLWTAWDGEQIAGMVALRGLADGAAEIKSMRVADAYRGRGVGKALLTHVIAQARGRGVSQLLLETGTGDEFVPAIRLYEAAGFTPCGRFADYPDDPFSRFYSLTLG